MKPAASSRGRGIFLIASVRLTTMLLLFTLSLLISASLTAFRCHATCFRRLCFWPACVSVCRVCIITQEVLHGFCPQIMKTVFSYVLCFSTGMSSQGKSASHYLCCNLLCGFCCSRNSCLWKTRSLCVDTFVTRCSLMVRCRALY